MNCPECGGKVLIKKTKKGRIYYGCEHNGDGCDFMSWNKPTAKNAPNAVRFWRKRAERIRKSSAPMKSAAI